MEQISDHNLTPVHPEAALSAIADASSKTPIVLDFDETLILRNSTAEYLNSLQPRFLGWILVMCLKVIRPWKLLPHPWGGERTRDWYLVAIPTLLLPWTLFLWQRQGKEIATEHSNRELIAAIPENMEAPLIVASLGFNFIIQPILNHLPLKCDRLVGCRFWQGAGDRNLGKLAMMQTVLSESELKSAILVTDSEDDLPLLQIVGKPLFVLWSSAQYITPFSDFWLYSWLKKFKQYSRSN